MLKSALLLCAHATSVSAYALTSAHQVGVATSYARSSVQMTLSRRAVGQAATAAAVLTPLGASAEGYPMISMQTSEGEMQFELWDDVAPKHVASFLKLSKEGCDPTHSDLHALLF
jgi:hypothetical protein